MQSPTNHDSRDPFQLQRLADELPDDYGDNRPLDSQRALPSYKPLSHDDPHLSSGAFDVELFLQSRSYTSLPDLRIELRDYLATLKEELVQLINDDYEAFISLSTDLRGEGTRLERLRWPLADLKSQTLVQIYYHVYKIIELTMCLGLQARVGTAQSGYPRKVKETRRIERREGTSSPHRTLSQH